MEAQVPKMREKDGITSHESSRSLISLCVDVVRALQTLCGLGCLEKEEKVVTYDQSGGRREAARRPQKQLKKKPTNSPAAEEERRRRDDMDTSDGRADEDARAGKRERETRFVIGRKCPLRSHP